MRLRASPPKRTAATIAAEIAQLDEVAGERSKALAALEDQRPALIEAGDVDAVEALDTRIRRAKIEAEIDASKRAKLAAEHAETKAAEDHAQDQAERRAAYKAATDAAEEARHLYFDEYPRLARELVALLTRTAEVGKQVEAANERLPDDAAPIPLDFEPFRGRAEVPARKATVRRHSWVHKKDGTVSVLSPTERRDDWRKEVRTEEIDVEAVRAIAHVPLQDAVSLPGLTFAAAPFWSPRPAYATPPGVEAMWRNLIKEPSPMVAPAPLAKQSSRSAR